MQYISFLDLPHTPANAQLNDAGSQPEGNRSNKL